MGRLTMHAGNFFRVLAHAAGNNTLAVLAQGLADGVQGFLLGGIDKTTGIYYHHIGILIGGHDVIAVHLQLREDALGIDQGLGAT